MDIKKFVKKHKFTCICIAIILVVIIIGIVLFIKFSPNYKKNSYGDRLNKIEKYEISDKSVTNLEKEVKELDNVEDVKYDLKGKLINITIEVKEEMEIDKAKEAASKCLEYFDEDEKGFYDIQIFVVSSDDKSEKYPIIGYKHKTSDSLVWSNNS